MHLSKNVVALRHWVSQECSEITLRIQFGSKKRELESSSDNKMNRIKSIYNVTFRDIDTTGFILLKHQYRFSFRVGDCYIADKIKLVLNAKWELVLKAT